MRKMILIVFFFPFLLSAQEVQENNLLTVVGFSETEIDPNWAIITMTAHEVENTKKESDLVKAENELMDFIVSIGLDRKNFSINSYHASSTAFSGSSKYRLSKSYELKLTDISMLDTIIDKCFSLEMNNIMISKVGHTDIKQLSDKVLALAVKDAQRKAELLARELGFKLGKVYSANENYSIVGNQTYNNDIGFFRLEDVVVTGYGMAPRTRSGSSLSLDKIKINKTVLVKYIID